MYGGGERGGKEEEEVRNRFNKSIEEGNATSLNYHFSLSLRPRKIKHLLNIGKKRDECLFSSCSYSSSSSSSS